MCIMSMFWDDKEFQSIFLSLWSFVCFTHYDTSRFTVSFPVLSCFCVSAPAVLVLSASVQAAKHLRCQHLPALNSINQINDDSNLSAVRSPPRTSWAIYRYCDPRTWYKVFSPAGCFCGCSSAAGRRAQMGQVTMPYILPPSVLRGTDIIKLIQNDGLICPIIKCHLRSAFHNVICFSFLDCLLSQYMTI